MSPDDAGFLFGFKARRRGHSRDSVTAVTTLKTDKKTSMMGILFASNSLTLTCAAAHTRRCPYSIGFNAVEATGVKASKTNSSSEFALLDEIEPDRSQYTDCHC